MRVCGTLALSSRWRSLSWEQSRLARSKYRIRRNSFYNEHVVVSSVPKSARNYLDSCSASGWLISRYWVMADEVSGIVNDFNDWVVEGTGNVSTVLTRPSCLLDLITCATNISIQAQQIVGSLPKLMVET